MKLKDCWQSRGHKREQVGKKAASQQVLSSQHESSRMKQHQSAAQPCGSSAAPRYDRLAIWMGPAESSALNCAILSASAACGAANECIKQQQNASSSSRMHRAAAECVVAVRCTLPCGAVRQLSSSQERWSRPLSGTPARSCSSQERWSRPLSSTTARSYAAGRQHRSLSRAPLLLPAWPAPLLAAPTGAARAAPAAPPPWGAAVRVSRIAVRSSRYTNSNLQMATSPPPCPRGGRLWPP